MKILTWRKLLPLVFAGALAVSAACAVGQPEKAETEKQYQLVLEVTGPAEISISHSGGESDAEPVQDVDHNRPVSGSADVRDRRIPEETGETEQAGDSGQPAEAVRETRVVTVTLPEGPKYDVRLDGTETGALGYTVILKDPDDTENDRVLHRFQSIPVNEKTVIKTVAGAEEQNTLLAYTDSGEGEEEKLTLDAAYGSGKNSVNITVNTQNVLLAGILVLILVSIPLLFRRKKKIVILQKPVIQRKG